MKRVRPIPKFETADWLRFVNKIDFKPMDLKYASKGCWMWTGAMHLNNAGQLYGNFSMERKQYLPHRIAYFAQYGVQPKNLICHICDNTLCVNPTHLFDGTDSENQIDKFQKGRYIRLMDYVVPLHLVKEIRRKYDVGISGPKLARIFGVAPNTIYKVIHCKAPYDIL